jgi:hypothetical protein
VRGAGASPFESHFYYIKTDNIMTGLDQVANFAKGKSYCRSSETDYRRQAGISPALPAYCALFLPTMCYNRNSRFLGRRERGGGGGGGGGFF